MKVKSTELKKLINETIKTETKALIREGYSQVGNFFKGVKDNNTDSRTQKLNENTNGYRYLGRCVDIGNNSRCDDYFENATDLAQYFDPGYTVTDNEAGVNPDNDYIQRINFQRFMNSVNLKSFAPSATIKEKNNYEYYYLTDIDMYVLYSKSKDIHYFFV
jgi:hypothetical protein